MKWYFVNIGVTIDQELCAPGAIDRRYMLTDGAPPFLNGFIFLFQLGITQALEYSKKDPHLLNKHFHL